MNRLAYRLFMFALATAAAVAVIAIADAVAGGPWAAPFALVFVTMVVGYDIRHGSARP